MSTLAELRVMVSRDLRDTNNRTFTSPYVDDLINAGIEEISRLAPQEVVDEIDVVASTYEYATTIEQAFRLEVFRNGIFQTVIPQSEGESSQQGWDLWAGMLRVPQAYINGLVAATDDLHLWGYGPWPQLAVDADEAGLDASREWAVRRYARSQAFTLMNNDRALFKQWQGQSQNTDVSPNQLNQMVSLYASEWDRTRNYLRRLRRN